MVVVFANTCPRNYKIENWEGTKYVLNNLVAEMWLKQFFLKYMFSYFQFCDKCFSGELHGKMWHQSHNNQSPDKFILHILWLFSNLARLVNIHLNNMHWSSMYTFMKKGAFGPEFVDKLLNKKY